MGKKRMDKNSYIWKILENSNNLFEPKTKEKYKSSSSYPKASDLVDIKLIGKSLENATITQNGSVCNGAVLGISNAISTVNKNIWIDGDVMLSNGVDSTYSLQEKIKEMEKQLEQLENKAKENESLSPIEKLRRKVNNFSIKEGK